MAASGLSLAAGRRLYTLQTFYSSAVGVLIALGTAAVVWVGARHVMDGSLSVGIAACVFVSYLASLYGPLYSDVPHVGRSPRDRRVGVERVFEVLDVEAGGARRAPASFLRRRAGRGRVEDVSFGYVPDARVLDGVSLACPPGMEGRDRGADRGGQVDPAEPAPALLRRRRPGASSSTASTCGTIASPRCAARSPWCSSPRSCSRRPCARTSRSAGPVRGPRRSWRRRGWRRSTRSSRRCREGYDTLVGEQGVTLSEGEKQRVTIARALLRDSPILILDEPTSSLDGETEALIMQGLERLTAGRTTFIIAHRLSTIRKADLIVVLRDGRHRRAGDLRVAHGPRRRLRLAVSRPGRAPRRGGPGRPVAPSLSCTSGGQHPDRCCSRNWNTAGAQFAGHAPAPRFARGPDRSRGIRVRTRAPPAHVWRSLSAPPRGTAPHSRRQYR